MKRIIYTMLCLLICCLTFIGCTDTVGGLNINNNPTINSTTFDTSNLRIVQTDPIGDINYAVKVIGDTNALSEKDWNTWFGDSSNDIAGKIAVCISLKLKNELFNDPSATITMPDITNNNEYITRKINELPIYLQKNNNLNIILNPNIDIATITLNYQVLNQSKDIIYQIDMINVNSSGERLG